MPIHLLAQAPGSVPAPGVAPRDYARHWTPVHADVVVTDLAAAVARAMAAGAALERPVVHRSWNAIAGLGDPFGHGVDLIAEPDDPRPGALDVAIDVPDVAAAVAFYVHGLGLTLRDEPMPGLWARLGGSAVTIHLQADPSRTYARHWTPVHLDFLTDDVEAGVRRARAAGATDDRPIHVAEWGRMANLADPFGHGLCLVELGPRGYDAVARNE